MSRVKREQEKALRGWIEAERVRISARAYGYGDPFLGAFFAQCAESTAADAYEVFWETPLSYNYFRENRDRLDREGVARLFRLTAIHHGIRATRRRKKELDWAGMLVALAVVYGLDEREKKLAALLYDCAARYQTLFSALFGKVTARYLFGDRELSGFSFAFIGNFWYNSYSSFMGSFTGYVPFHIRFANAR